MTETQLELDLGDKFQRAEFVLKRIRREQWPNNSHVRVFRCAVPSGFKYYIGTRIFVVDVDIRYIYEIDLETALHLYDNHDVWDYLGWVKEHRRKAK